MSEGWWGVIIVGQFIASLAFTLWALSLLRWGIDLRLDVLTRRVEEIERQKHESDRHVRELLSRWPVK